MRNIRHSTVQDNRKKRKIVYVTSGILVVVYLTLHMIMGENGLLKYMKLKAMKNRLHSETSVMQKQNEDANRQIETLKKEPDRVEELARGYGLTKKGELIYKFDSKP
ncbi:MAG: septum formation initiator family protein [Nitrospirota bacterium]